MLFDPHRGFFIERIEGSKMCEHCNEDLREIKGFNKIYKELGNKLYEDLSGMKFGKLQPVKPVGRTKQSRVVWLCKCDCGKHLITDASTLKSGKGRSCGCLSAESRRENLEGKVFTRWTVIKDEGGDKVYCKCSCGTERWVDRGNLRGGISTSCGCYKKEQMHDMFGKDLTGQIFGRLTVLSENGRSRDGRILWKARCSCGNEITVLGYNLLKGHTKSCGCLKHEMLTRGQIKPMIGKTFGLLTVLKEMKEEKEKGKSVRYLCQCACGTKITVDGSMLRSGNTSSCGCLNSKGEMKISQILQENSMEFKKQKTYKDLRTTSKFGIPKFDFYIPDGNYLIEFDGKQHYEANNKGWNDLNNLKKTQERDMVKNEYCKRKSIPLIRIPYTQLKHLCLEDLLLETTKFRVV